MSLQLSQLLSYRERESRPLATGLPALDTLIEGWPSNCVIEILSKINYLTGLFNPLLYYLRDQSRSAVWIDPPYLPCGLPDPGRALIVVAGGGRSTLWSMEQALMSSACGLVLAWPGRVRFAEVRRLQLAAERGRALGVLVLPAAAGRDPSPAALRLQLDTAPDGALKVGVLKRRGHWAGAGSVCIPR